MAASEAINLLVLYKLIKEISTPFDETKAFSLGLVDKEGKLLKSPKTKKEKEAYSPFNRFVFNIKRLLGKFGMDSKTGTFAAALFLLKEENGDVTEKEFLKGILESLEELQNNNQLFEEIANVTGSMVPGTGDDTAHWSKKKKGRPRKMNTFINGITYLRRTAANAVKKGK